MAEPCSDGAQAEDRAALCTTPSAQPQQQQQQQRPVRVSSAGSRPPVRTPGMGGPRPHSAATQGTAATHGTEDSCVTAVSAQVTTGGALSPAAQRGPQAVWMLAADYADAEPLLPLLSPPRTQQVAVLEARRRGVCRSGRLELEPFAAHPIERADSDPQLWVVTEGHVDVLTMGAMVSVSRGGCFVILPRTSYTIVAGEEAAELVYAQSLGGGPIGPQDPGYRSSLVRRHELAAEEAARLEGEESEEADRAVLGTARHIALVTADHRRYVQRLRQELDAAQSIVFRGAQLVRYKRTLADEADSRSNVGAQELQGREELERGRLESEQEVGRVDFARLRMSGTIVPWCTLGCNYCCALQHELYTQVSAMAVRELGVLERSCDAAGEALRTAESLEWRRILVASWSISRQQQLFEKERELLLREATIRWLALLVELQQEDLSLRHKEHLGMETLRFEEDAWDLRNQSHELARGTELLHLREEAFARAQQEAIESHETLLREKIHSDQERERALALRLESEGRVLHLCQQYEKRLRVLQGHARELQEYKNTREAQDAEVERQRREAEQERLLQELEDMRKARKKKATTASVPSSVVDKEQCDKCGGRVNKTQYALHIQRDCPERPVQCQLCGQATRARVVDAHLEECPQRDVRCDGCAKVYKAQQMAVHLPLCERIRQARQLLPTYRPVLGVEIADGERGLRVATVKQDGPLDGSGVQDDDVMVSFAGAPTQTKADFIAAIKKRRPGDEVVVCFLPSSRAVGPWWEADAAGDPDGGQAMQPHSVTCRLATTIPLEEYWELERLVKDDDEMCGHQSERETFSGEFGALAKGRRKTGKAGGRASVSSKPGAKASPGQRKLSSKPSGRRTPAGSPRK